jgi:hypothetical protein
MFAVITRQQVEAHLEQLHVELQQLQNNVSAYMGAIQDNEHWLAVLTEMEEEAPDDGPNPADE